MANEWALALQMIGGQKSEPLTGDAMENLPRARFEQIGRNGTRENESNGKRFMG